MHNAVGYLAQRLREHANDRVRLRVQVDGTAYDPRISPEGLRPHGITDQDDSGLGKRVVLVESTAEGRSYT